MSGIEKLDQKTISIFVYHFAGGYYGLLKDVKKWSSNSNFVLSALIIENLEFLDYIYGDSSLS